MTLLRHHIADNSHRQTHNAKKEIVADPDDEQTTGKVRKWYRDAQRVCMQICVASAEETVPPTQPALQPYLPSLTFVQTYETIPL